MAADALTLARWGHLLYGGSVVDASVVDQMTDQEDERDWYGLGTELMTDGEDTFVGHAGDLGVYHSILVVWPDGTSVVVLVPSAAPLGLDIERTPFGLARSLHEAADG